MLKSCRKILIFFLCLFFFYLFLYTPLSTNTVFAKLEVPYKPIMGHSITDSSTLPEYAIYLFSAGMVIGFSAVFISLVWAGTLYFLSPISAQIKADAKDRIGGAISGLLILLLTYLIVITINPELKTFRLKPLPSPSPLPSPEIRISGVSFYSTGGCAEETAPENTNETAAVNTYSISDLGDLKNNVNSVKIIQGAGESYISILYDNPNFWGKCLYLNPNAGCQPAVDPDFGDIFADSASIYRYDFSPNGDGVYFYHKSYFDESGGWLKVSNQEIKSGGGGGVYTRRLEDLHFMDSKNGCNVPEKEQNCVKYDERGVCEKRECPSLSGENLSSMQIKGGYLVVLTYAEPGQDCDDIIADSCQEFPTPDDVNRIGPQQIKWDHIRNDQGIIPNCVFIVPIKY